MDDGALELGVRVVAWAILCEGDGIVCFHDWLLGVSVLTGNGI